MARKKWKKLLIIAPFGIVGMLLFVALGGWLVETLWNWLMPSLFGWPAITFWKAVGLLGLCRILFGGLGIGGNGRHRCRDRMEERSENMTPEERERFRERMRERFGFGPDPGESKEAGS